jgi:hypothetical protein
LLTANLVPGSLALPGLTLPLPAWVAIFFVLLFVVWMINLYNFMDGMDGFAGGMATIGFSALAWLGWADAGFAAFCLIVAAASAGFLVHNFPPAKIFLGDTGSIALGFLAAAFSLWGAKDGLFPFWVALLVFSPFIVDATVTSVASPAARRKGLGSAPSHYYQRLVLLGWGHRRTVLDRIRADAGLRRFRPVGGSIAARWTGHAGDGLGADLRPADVGSGAAGTAACYSIRPVKLEHFLNLPSTMARRALLIAGDALAVLIAVWASFAIRLGDWWPDDAARRDLAVSAGGDHPDPDFRRGRLCTARSCATPTKACCTPSCWASASGILLMMAVWVFLRQGWCRARPG